MQYVVTAEEIKHYDTYTIEKTGIPSLLLMERAAMEVVLALEERCRKKSRVIIFAGCGNNGGDGLAIGRLLAEKGAEVTFYMPGEPGRVSTETKKQMEILLNLGFSIQRKLPPLEYDILIDALFGVGLSREITGVYREAVEEINRLGSRGTYVAAVDIASGICADTGRVMGCAVRADMTVSFSYAKAGQLFYPGREYTGQLLVREIGVDKKAEKEMPASYRRMDETEMKALLPARSRSGNKGTFGKVLVAAGGHEMCGAALLCARSVLKTGAGMVKIITSKRNREVLMQALPEAMLSVYGEMPKEEEIESCLAWADVIVAGPGIGKGREGARLMELLLRQGQLPFVMDADGLNLIAKEEALWKLTGTYERGRMILTPHPGELVRLKKETMDMYRQNPGKAVKELARQMNCVVVGKDAVTLVASPKEESIFINGTGNDGMATAGSGDVLAGMIGGLLAQHMEAFQAACVGVALHGVAGDRAALAKSRYSMTASDIIEKIGVVLAEQA